MKLVDITEGRNFPQRKDFGQIVNAVKKAATTLQGRTLMELISWQRSQWRSGAIQLAHNGKEPNPELLDELAQAFAPVKQLLHKYYGQTITLHRGERTYNVQDHETERTLYSWTLDLDTARSFSGKQVLSKTITDQQMQQLVDQYNKTGFVKVFGYSLLRNKESPEYFTIFRNGQVITDGDNIEKFIRRTNDERIEGNKEKEGKGNVYTQEIPIDKIIWILPDLGSAEFIVAETPNRG